jgi:anthranilate synthase component II
MLLIDNYDSFTHNLAQLFSIAGAEVVVRRSSSTMDELVGLRPDALLISPGPGRPDETGVSREALLHWCHSVPVLGVCLGMQLINEVYGGVTVHAPSPVHGKTDELHHDGSGVLVGVPSPFRAARYHSLAIRRAGSALVEQAWGSDGTVMAVRHRTLEIHGVQFHPESFLTEHGGTIARNFLNIVKRQKGNRSR